jgi:REP element-mobilizing transposase RayT
MTCLLTWSCYATHITPYRCKPLREWRRAHCRFPPFQFDAANRDQVLRAILEHARDDSCTLLAVHLRSTHVHVVATHVADPDRLCASLKAHATRRLRQLGAVPAGRPIWADFRNIRILRTRDAILSAMMYVVEKQGPPMALWQIDPAFPI